MPVSIPFLFSIPSDTSVAMFCFHTGLIAIAIGLYVWLRKRPDIFPGYKENEILDPDGYAKLRGQSLMTLGFALFTLSLSINAQESGIIILAASLIFVVFLLMTALYLHLQAGKKRRK